MLNKYNFSNAILHFARTDGPSGFIWKYVLSYCVMLALIAVATYYLLQPLWSVYGQLFFSAMESGGETSPDFDVDAIVLIGENLGRIIGGYLIVFVMYLLVWAMFEAAIQRRYVRDECFAIRFGGDELRMIVIGIIWTALYLAASIIIQLATLGLVMPVAQMTGDAGFAIIWSGVVTIGLFVGWAVLMIRWSAAAALTIRDRKIRFFDSWVVTKGNFWNMLGAYLVLGLVLAIAWFILYGVLLGGLLGALFTAPGVLDGETFDPAAALEFVNQPAVLAIGLVAWTILIGFYVIAGYIWAGVAALAAKTDPRGGGLVNAPDVFN